VGGYRRHHRPRIDHPLVLQHADGRWRRRTPPPVGPKGGFLAAVAVVGRQVWAVGSHRVGEFSKAYVARSTSGSWHVFDVPHPGDSSQLFDVLARSKLDVWAVGSYERGLHSHTLIEHWHGGHWTRVPSPNPTTRGTQLYGIAQQRNRRLWAVGQYQGRARGLSHPLVERLGARGWRVVQVPAPRNGELNGVAASRRRVWAVGDYSTRRRVFTLVERKTRSGWETVPSDDPGLLNVLDGVDTGKPDRAWAVGSESGRTLAERCSGA